MRRTRTTRTTTRATRSRPKRTCFKNSPTELPDAAAALLKDVEQVKYLRDQTGATTGLSEEDLDALHDVLTATIKLIGKLQ